MSLKLVKQSLKARPSKMSFISDFEDSDSFQNQSLSIEHQKVSNFQDLEENLRPESGNEPTILQSPIDESLDFKTLNSQNLGFEGLTGHSKQKVQRILDLFQAGNSSKMKLYLERLKVFSNKDLGYWSLNPEEIYQDFQCFDLYEGNRPMGFMNGYLRIQCLLGESEKSKEKEMKSILALENDCYSAIKYPGFPFLNALILGLFSGSLNFVDITKEKNLKKFKVEAPISLIYQENTLIFAGDVKSSVSCFDYRLKSPYEKVFVEQKACFEPIQYIDREEELLLAGNKEKSLIWDLRNTKDVVYKVDFSEKKPRKAAFLSNDKLIVGDFGENKAKIMDLKTKKLEESLDFKKKIIKDMTKIQGNKAFVWLVENEKRKNETYCSIFNERKKGMKVEDWMALEGKVEKVFVSDKMRLLGMVGKDEVRMIGWKDPSGEKIVNGKLKTIINK